MNWLRCSHCRRGSWAIHDDCQRCWRKQMLTMLILLSFELTWIAAYR